MGRPPTGRVDARQTSDGDTVFSIRIPYQGGRRRITLGSMRDGWTHAEAEKHLSDTMAALRLGVSLDTLFPPNDTSPVHPTTNGEPTLSTLIRDYLEDRRGSVAVNTLAADTYALRHVEQALGKLTPSEVTPQVVDRFRRDKVRERDALIELAAAGKPVMQERSMERGGRTIRWEQPRKPLKDTEINRLVTQLGTILDVAMERSDVRLQVNPARGRRRKIAVKQPAHRSFLEPEQVWALLDAAEARERRARDTHGDARALPAKAILGTLVMGGERISELCTTRRMDLNVPRAVIRVPDSKTAAGFREVDLLFAALVDILSDHLARRPGRGRDPLFATSTGSRLSPGNVRRLLRDVVVAADELCEVRGVPLIGSCTPHALRRTNISLLCAAGCDPVYIMAQVGHADPRLTLRIYAQLMKRKRADEYREKVSALLGVSPLRQAGPVSSGVLDVVPVEWEAPS